MQKIYNKWLERRHSSKWKPRIYLAAEVLALIFLLVLIYFVLPKPIAVVSTAGVLYFFYYSSLPRYIKVRDRQHFPKKKHKHQTHEKPLERRERSEIKPLLYIATEICLLALVTYMVSLLKILPLTIIAVLGAIYFFIISSLERYERVMMRQGDNEEEEHS